MQCGVKYWKVITQTMILQAGRSLFLYTISIWVSFKLYGKTKNAENLWLRLFSALNSRGWENRTPTKGFGDPYHTIWPIPYIQLCFHHCCNYTYKTYNCQEMRVLFYTKYKYHHIFNWWKNGSKRRWRDLNPRTGCPAYRISSADPSATWVHLRMLSKLSSSFRENLYYYIRYPEKGQSFLKLFFFVLLTNLPDYNMIMR